MYARDSTGLIASITHYFKLYGVRDGMRLGRGGVLGINNEEVHLVLPFSPRGGKVVHTL